MLHCSRNAHAVEADCVRAEENIVWEQVYTTAAHDEQFKYALKAHEKYRFF